VVAAADAPRFLAHLAAWGEPGATIGRIVPLAASDATAHGRNTREGGGPA
jgi:hypothetical protein